MDIEEPEKKELSLVNQIREVSGLALELVEEIIGIAASPATLWANILWNPKFGFSGYVSNPTSTSIYRGWTILHNAAGWQGQNVALALVSDWMPTFDQVKNWIDSLPIMRGGGR
jgi:hypothetical protein